MRELFERADNTRSSPTPRISSEQRVNRSVPESSSIAFDSSNKNAGNARNSVTRADATSGKIRTTNSHCDDKEATGRKYRQTLHADTTMSDRMQYNAPKNPNDT